MAARAAPARARPATSPFEIPLSGGSRTRRVVTGDFGIRVVDGGLEAGIPATMALSRADEPAGRVPLEEAAGRGQHSVQYEPFSRV
jgi:hypothetical protein